MSYRATPRPLTKQTPSEMFIGRRINKRIELIKPDVRAWEEKKLPARKFVRNEKVFTKNFSRGEKRGKITHKLSPTYYEVLLSEDKLIKRHIDHLLRDNTSEELEGVLLSETTNTENAVSENSTVQCARYPQRIRRPVERYGINSDD